MSKTLDIQKFYHELEVFRIASKKMPKGKRGWISKIREELNIPLSFLAKRLGVTPQAVHELEKNENLFYSGSKDKEKFGGVSIDAMKKIATALNMEFVYGFVPLSTAPSNRLKDEIRKHIESEMTIEEKKACGEQHINRLVDENFKNPPKSLWSKIYITKG